MPDNSPIQSVEELCGKRIVTSFENLATDYFAELDKKQGLVKAEEKTEINYISGSVEAACALGLADAIGIIIIHTQLKMKLICDSGSRGIWGNDASCSFARY